ACPSRIGRQPQALFHVAGARCPAFHARFCNPGTALGESHRMGGRRSSQCRRSPSRSFAGRRAGESGENGYPTAAFLSDQLVDGRRSRSVGEGGPFAPSSAHSHKAGEGIDSPGERCRGAYGRLADDRSSLAGQPERGAPGARATCPIVSLVRCERDAKSATLSKAALYISVRPERDSAGQLRRRDQAGFGSRLPSQYGKAWSILEKLVAPGSPLSSIIPHYS